MLRDFIRERRVVVHDGRRFLVRKPTVETVSLAMLHFGGLLAGCRLAWRKLEANRDKDQVDLFLSLFLGSSGLVGTLESCTEPVEGLADALAGHGGAALAEQIVRAALSMVDVGVLIEFTGLDRIVDDAQAVEENPDEDDDAPSSMEILIAGVAKHFSMDPLDIMGWPCELLVTMAEKVIPAMNPGPPDPMHLGKSRKEWEKLGVTISDQVH